MSEVDNRAPDVKRGFRRERLALARPERATTVAVPSPRQGADGVTTTERPPLSVVLGTATLVVELAYILLFIGVVAVALLALGLKLGVGVSGDDPIILQDLHPNLVVLIVVAVLLLLVVVAVALLLRGFVRGVWQGRPKRTWAAIILFALTSFTNISAVQAEGTIPIRVAGAIISPVGLALFLLPPSAWRWRGRKRRRRLAEESAEHEDAAQTVVIALPEGDTARNPTDAR